VTTDRIGPYRIVRALPSGGNADVYIGVEDDQSEEVAVKVLRGRPGTERWQRFVREVTVVRDLGTFDGVLPILKAGIPDEPAKGDQAWYAMPLAVRADEALSDASLEEIVSAVASFAETLSRLHAQGHHHRDIKPANLYRREGVWEVGDFGLVDVPDKESLTQSNRRFGPANFLPYEVVIRPDTAKGGPVDVYELAKTLWVLAAPGLHYAPLGPQAADGGPYSLDRLTEGHPLASDLDMIVETCTRTDPEQRPSMSQLAGDLRAWEEMADRRAADEDAGGLRDAAASLRTVFADDFSAGRLKEQRLRTGQDRISTLEQEIGRLGRELASLLPGAVSYTAGNEMARTSLAQWRTDQIPPAVFSTLHGVIVKPHDDDFRPQLVLAAVGELEENGDFFVRSGAFIEYPRLDNGEAGVLFENLAPVDGAETTNAIERAVDELRQAAPTWMAKLRAHDRRGS
jgi:hypothetical protein